MTSGKITSLTSGKKQARKAGNKQARQAENKRAGQMGNKAGVYFCPGSGGQWGGTWSSAPLPPLLDFFEKCPGFPTRGGYWGLNF